MKVPVFLGSAEGEVRADKPDGHEKWALAALGRPKSLYGLCGNSSISIVFILGIRCFKSSPSWKRTYPIEFLVGEVGLFSGQFSSLRAGRVEILDDLVMKMRDTEGEGIALVAMTDVENFPHRFSMIAMFRKKLGHGDGLWHGMP